MKLSYVSLCFTMMLFVPCAASEQKNDAWYKKAALYVAAPLAVVAAAYLTWHYKNAKNTEQLENDKDSKPISQSKQELLKIWYSPRVNKIKSWFSPWSWEQWLLPKK